MIRWNAFTEFLFHMGVLGQAAYLAEPAKRLMGVWVFLAFLMVPYLALALFRHGEYSDETVARAHLLATLWYLALTLMAVALAVAGYRPPGWIAILVLIAPGALISLAYLLHRLRDPPPPYTRTSVEG